jgi:Asp-tRNA(Asn)/Glu-tRNA(Gln) amidotransferase A subunit family amidase
MILAPPLPFQGGLADSNLVAVHRRILYKGISDSLAKDYESSAGKMSDGLLEVVREGQKCTEEAFMTAFRIADACRTEVNEMFGNLDAIICPSTPSEAPEGWGTGSPIFQVMWTLLGVPCLNLPVGFGPNQMPLGVQLIGRRYDDANLLALGDYLMRNFKSIQIESFSNAKS